MRLVGPLLPVEIYRRITRIVRRSSVLRTLTLITLLAHASSNVPSTVKFIREQISFSRLLFRWFVGLNMGDAICYQYQTCTVFQKVFPCASEKRKISANGFIRLRLLRQKPF